jgi:hypothetical protein
MNNESFNHSQNDSKIEYNPQLLSKRSNSEVYLDDHNKFQGIKKRDIIVKPG